MVSERRPSGLSEKRSRGSAIFSLLVGESQVLEGPPNEAVAAPWWGLDGHERPNRANGGDGFWCRGGKCARVGAWKAAGRAETGKGFRAGRWWSDNSTVWYGDDRQEAGVAVLWKIG